MEGYLYVQRHRAKQKTKKQQQQDNNNNHGAQVQWSSRAAAFQFWLAGGSSV
jgi:hypothetical protein